MIYNDILKELEQFAPFFETPEYKRVVQLISGYHGRGYQIIGVAAGRMGYSLRAFIMRLSHMGFRATMIGDTNVPRAGPRTLLIVSSSSGSTLSNLLLAQQAKDDSACVLAFTASDSSPISNVATESVSYGNVESSQFMKTVYEQFTFLMFDKLAEDVREYIGVDREMMEKSHSRLE
jgi:6-phospho-3-hexuloisomerase